MSDAAEPEAQAITSASEILLRQVHPTHFPEGGTLSKMAFVPGPGHDDLLSTLLGRVGAKAAYERWLAMPYESVGTWGVSVGDAHSAGLSCLDDGRVSKVPDHASINFEKCTSTGAKLRAARKLRDAAAGRPLTR